MWCFAVDENFDNRIVRGLLRQKPDLDLARVQDDPERMGINDAAVLAWAADEGRVLLTHDVKTMTAPFLERIESGQPMPGVFEINQTAPLRQTIEEILLIVECSEQSEWEDQIRYLPL
jgi:hypothetical protein